MIKNKSIKNLYSQYILPGHRIILFFAILASLFTTFVNIIFPYLLKKIIDLAEARNIPEFKFNVILFSILWLSTLIALYIYSYGLERIKVEVKKRLRLDLLRKLHTISYIKIISTPQGSYVQRILDDVDKIEPLIIETYLELITQTLLGIGALYFMLKMSVLLTVVSVLPLPIYIGLMILYQKKAQVMTQKRQEDYQHVVAFLDESISNTYIVRNLGIINKILEKFKTLYNIYLKSYIRLFLLNFYYGSLLNFLVSMGVQLFIIVLGAILILHGKLTTGSVIAFMLYVNYVKAPLQYILSFSTTIEPAKVSLSRVYEILKEKETYYVDKLSSLKQSDGEYAIRIRNLNFGYEKEKSVIKGLNVEIGNGEWVCVVGESGMGKSTLLNILLKHFPIPSGKVFLFDKDINKMTIGEILSLITLIEQEPQFFGDMSVYENLTLGKEISWDEIVKIADKIGMGQLLQKISKDKKILLKNSGLSGGEKKRLALLRGILRDTPIILMDEPTAFIDRKSALNILSKLKEVLNGKTVIITTHDEKVISFCDKKIYI